MNSLCSALITLIAAVYATTAWADGDCWARASTTTARTKLYAAPRENSPVLEEVPAGTPLPVKASSDDWVNVINRNGDSSWVKVEHLQLGSERVKVVCKKLLQGKSFPSIPASMALTPIPQSPEWAVARDTAIQSFEAKANERIDELEQRLTQLEQRIGKLEGKIPPP